MRENMAVRASAVIGLLFGALSVVAGARVLAGVDRPDYVVLPWLVRYNVAAGIVGVVVGVGLWQLRGWAVRLAWTLARFHGVVLMALIAWLGVKGPRVRILPSRSLFALACATSLQPGENKGAAKAPFPP